MSNNTISELLSACMVSGGASVAHGSYLTTSKELYMRSVEKIDRYIDMQLAGVQKSANRNSEKASAFRTRLNDYRGLVHGWDGGVGVAPAIEVLESVEALFDIVVQSGYPIPDPTISSEGEVGLYWRENSIYINLEVEESGSYSFYGQNAKGTVKFLDGLSVSSGLSPEVISFINLISSAQSNLSLKASKKAVSRLQDRSIVSRRALDVRRNRPVKSYVGRPEAVNEFESLLAC